jgi:hypothetical protein
MVAFNLSQLATMLICLIVMWITVAQSIYFARRYWDLLAHTAQHDSAVAHLATAGVSPPEPEDEAQLQPLPTGEEEASIRESLLPPKP